MRDNSPLFPPNRRVAVALGLVVFASAASRSVAAEPAKTPAELFPDTTVAYAEVSEPRRLVAALYDHPIAVKLQNDDDYRPLLATPEYAKFRFGLGMVELAVGMGWRKAVEQLTEGGVAVGLDAQTGGVALVVRATDAEALERLRDRALKLVRDDARNKGNPDPVKTAEYRGVTAYQLDRFKFATHGPWLVSTESNELGKLLIDRLLDGVGDKSLARDESFQRLRSDSPTPPLVWGCVRLDKLRDAGQAQDLFKGKADNPVAELLVGGLLATVQKASAVTASVEANGSDFLLRVASPYDPQWMPLERAYYFGEDGNGRAPAPLRPPGTLLNLTAYRDLAALWNSGPDLFDEKANAELNQANSGLSTLFSGRDFAQDVLTSIRPEWQVVVARQTYERAPSTPQLKLPAGALVVDLRDPDKTRREWKVTFQSLIGFLNVVSSMQGQPPLELDSEKVEGIQLVTASYLPPEEGKKPAAGAIQYNFSPSLALIDSRMIIASTRGLALDLARGNAAAEAQTPPAAEAQTTRAAAVNSRLTIDVGPLRAALVDNRDQLIARNMLEKGHGREDAEREIDTLLKVAELWKGLDLRLQTTGDRLELLLRLGL